MASTKSRAAVLLAFATVFAACSHSVGGHSRSSSAIGASAPTVQAADLGRLLLSDAEMSETVGVPGLVGHDPYQKIMPPQGESYSDPSCAAALFNTMYTAYQGIAYTGAAGTKVGLPGDDAQHDTDQGVVSFRNADDASRFVTRTVLEWDRCADNRVSVTDNKPGAVPLTYTIGFATTTGNVSTLLDSPEGGDGYVCERAISSRSNVVIDVHMCGMDVKAEQAAAVVNGIADKMPR